MFRVRELRFHAALRERYRVLDFFTSGEPLPAFLAAAAADQDPPRALVTAGGDSVRVDAAFLDAVPSLRFVFSAGAGLDHIHLGECARRGVAVANSGTVYSTDVADHAVGMLVDVLHRVSAAERFIRRGLWPLQQGATIPPAPRYFPTVHDLACESDVLVVACALSKETRHIVNKDVLDALGKDGVVINIGRGLSIDEEELVSALAEGRIAGAGLDVFEKEPQGACGALLHGQCGAEASLRGFHEGVLRDVTYREP
ncbi:unnamed protein product [Miscanthus lutarioriparius]|uniref:D-isomer specific 2-hydroxyacid dehydrogenase NAD-binding domain-containing protein n=1 Tax=Miscanthus lutarioriparius TaxID=422564 RepID=A0A811QYG4_9POAL|nr:unnamed protein product [Miscanthus lutarioriparius]